MNSGTGRGNQTVTGLRPTDFSYGFRRRCPHRPFTEHRKGDWISDVKSTKSQRRSSRSKNDRLWEHLTRALVSIVPQAVSVSSSQDLWSCASF